MSCFGETCVFHHEDGLFTFVKRGALVEGIWKPNVIILCEGLGVL